VKRYWRKVEPFVWIPAVDTAGWTEVDRIPWKTIRLEDVVVQAPDGGYWRRVEGDDAARMACKVEEVWE
jgi:hypothetical protein